jgi:hypothetical protein
MKNRDFADLIHFQRAVLYALEDAMDRTRGGIDADSDGGCLCVWHPAEKAPPRFYITISTEPPEEDGDDQGEPAPFDPAAPRFSAR